jgi:hypothetical protein
MSVPVVPGAIPARFRLTVLPSVAASAPSAGGWPAVMLKNASRLVAMVCTSELPALSTNAASKASLTVGVAVASNERWEYMKVSCDGVAGTV